MNFFVRIEPKIILVIPFIFLADIFNSGHPDMLTYCRAAIKKITIEKLVLWMQVVLGNRLLIRLKMFDRNGLSGNAVSI